MAHLAWLATAMVLFGGPLTAGAAPPRYPRPATSGPIDPALAPGETAWAEAEREPDRAVAAERWRAAARAFTTVAAATAHDHGLRARAAEAAVLAWKNALAVDPAVAPRRRPVDASDLDRPPEARPLTADEAGFVEAIDLHLALGAPSTDELAELRFLRGDVLRRANRFDEAAGDFEVVVAHDPSADLAGYAAALLLDGLNQTRRYDELVALAHRLHTDAALVRAHPELAERLALIERHALRKQAEQAEQAAQRTGDRDGFARCADLYDQVAASPLSADDVEVVYNAALCAAWAGEADRALARLDAILRDRPRAPLAARALQQHAALAERIGRIAVAADDWARYAHTYAGDATAAGRMADAVALRLALGDRDRAERDATWLATSAAPRARRDAGLNLAAVAAARLAHGERAQARRLLTTAITSWRAGDADRDAAFAALVWDAACPVAPSDGLCLAPKRAPRDRALARFALALLQRGPRADGQVLLADAALEVVLAIATPPPARRGDAWRAQVELAAADAQAAYLRVLAGPDADGDAVIRAHAGLGQLALHRHALDLTDATAPVDELTTARQEYARCERLAADQRPSLLELCERGLARAGIPAPPRPERRPPPAPTPLAPALEP
ncbi:MAG: hypothetical protein IPL61_35640 [Myxococcales bacterium]|nr:hypothetical protein [Myxococcales bacterium]